MFEKSQEPSFEHSPTEDMLAKAVRFWYNNKKEKKHKESRFHNKFLRLLPKGTRRREFVKKVTCFFSGRDYIEPNYAVEGIIVKYKKK